MQATPPAIVEALPAIPADFSITHLRPRAGPMRILRDCPDSDSTEIVVCGRANVEPYRLRPLPPMPKELTAMEKATELMTLRLGPVELSPGISKEGVGMKMKIRF